ncbi:hypothetical protein L2X99_01180 [Microbacterium sp. KUDC0406]|uniref:hypothetical protein n=1 Tax=Microbacterium sp. KUDC0406 TaxID=2909588 RepID=UPI001F268D37|nr:hypothetical protein [Microbacterium sp. KUDC0406]UJP10356.1 hypothetical protein L2X99_01180 [Microbacterium sp. KUDC0406]
MAFHLIQNSSRALLSPAAADVAAVAPAQRAVEILGPDYLRWSRLGMGALGFVGALVGASGPGAIVDAVASGQPPVVVAFAAIMGVLLIAVLALSVWLLVSLAVSGSRLVRSLASWLGGPYRSGQLAASWSGWLHTRLLLFRLPVFTRIAAASCAALFAVYAVYAFISSLAVPSANAVVYACWAAVAIATSVCLFSGSIRLISGRAEADRVWRSVRDGSFR